MYLPTFSAPSPGLAVVRRRDLAWIRQVSWHQAHFPPQYGYLQPVPGSDLQFPLPPEPQARLAFLIDFFLHVAGAVIIQHLCSRMPGVHVDPYFIAIGAFIVLSIVDRIVIQWVFQATLGKMIFFLCVVRSDTLGRPSLGALTRQWLLSIIILIQQIETTPGV